MGPRGRDRLPRGHLERADRGRLRLHRRPGRAARPRRGRDHASPRGCRSRSTAATVTPLRGSSPSSTSGPARRASAGSTWSRTGWSASRAARSTRRPGAIALITAHQELENVTVERDLARFKRQVDQRWGELVYDGLWFSPLKRALDAFIDEAAAARHRRGPADAARRPGGGHRPAQRGLAVRLRPGHLRRRATRSTSRLAKGFVELWGLPSRIAACATPRTLTRLWRADPRPGMMARVERTQGGRRCPRAHADPAVGRPVRRRPGRGAGPAVGQRPVRLAARPVRPARLAGARPGAAPGRPARRGELGRHARRAGRPRGGVPAGDVPADRRRRGRAHRAGARPAGAARHARRQAARRPQSATTRSPPTCGSTCATTPGASSPGWSSWQTR